MANLLQTKSLSTIMGEAAETGEHSLSRSLGAWQPDRARHRRHHRDGHLRADRPAAAHYAGPGVVYSFILAAVGCVFAGLCYAEFAAMIPVAGSAYTYGYATLGEIFAWIIGWDLVLEYAFGAATVCSGWSGYVLSLGQDFGLRLPPDSAGTPARVCPLPRALGVPGAHRAASWRETAHRSRYASAAARHLQSHRLPRHHAGDRRS